MSPAGASIGGSLGGRPRTRAIRVALVDHQQGVAEKVRRALDRDPGRFEYVGSAGRLADVPGLLRHEPADVVFVDERLPDCRGAEVLRAVRRQWPRARLILFNGHGDTAMLHEAIAAGADGVLTKDVGAEHLLEVVERAHRGDVLLDAGTLRELMAHRSEDAGQPEARDSLTPRERSVLEAILAAGTTQEAARQVHMAPATLRVHIHRASQKLGARSRLEAISLALGAGLIQAPPADAPTRVTGATRRSGRMAR